MRTQPANIFEREADKIHDIASSSYATPQISSENHFTSNQIIASDSRAWPQSSLERAPCWQQGQRYGWVYGQQRGTAHGCRH